MLRFLVLDTDLNRDQEPHQRGGGCLGREVPLRKRTSTAGTLVKAIVTRGLQMRENDL